MARLKAAWPETCVSWVVNTEWAALLVGNPDVDDIVPFPRRKFRGISGAGNFIRWCGETIAGRKPALALDFQGLLRSALIGRASRPAEFYGMADAREGARWLYQSTAPMPTGVTHAVQRYLALADFAMNSMGVRAQEASNDKLQFPLSEGEPPASMTSEILERFIVLHPFARGAGKSLTASQIQAFCERLAPQRVVLVGKRGATDFNVPAGAVDLVDQTSLPELIWVIRRAACVISVDSGPSHLAAALDTPLVAVHTWSDPRRVGPYRADAWVWKSGRLLTMAQITTQNEAFFQPPSSPLSAEDIDLICARATSLSRSCA